MQPFVKLSPFSLSLDSYQSRLPPQWLPLLHAAGGSVKDLSLSSLSPSPRRRPTIILCLFIFIAETLAVTSIPARSSGTAVRWRISLVEHVRGGNGRERLTKENRKGYFEVHPSCNFPSSTEVFIMNASVLKMLCSPTVLTSLFFFFLSQRKEIRSWRSAYPTRWVATSVWIVV